MAADPIHPSDQYAQFNCQGIWKSRDYGRTFRGPINTGTNGATVSDCAGEISLAPGTTGGPPTIFKSCIRGAASAGPSAFWRSLDGGVNWKKFALPNPPAPFSGRYDYYAPAVDSYDPKHLILPGHEIAIAMQSTDGGKTWSQIRFDPDMRGAGTSIMPFIDTGNATTTRGTWLWISQQSGGRDQGLQ